MTPGSEEKAKANGQQTSALSDGSISLEPGGPFYCDLTNAKVTHVCCRKHYYFSTVTMSGHESKKLLS